MSQHEMIHYVELPASDMPATQRFFELTFAWRFTHYGDDYMSFEGAGLEGGFFKSDKTAHSFTGSALVIFYSDDLAATQNKVETNGGALEKPVFEFPGGKRFHFTCPSGNEFAVWTKT